MGSLLSPMPLAKEGRELGHMSLASPFEAFSPLCRREKEELLSPTSQELPGPQERRVAPSTPPETVMKQPKFPSHPSQTEAVGSTGSEVSRVYKWLASFSPRRLQKKKKKKKGIGLAGNSLAGIWEQRLASKPRLQP